MKASQVGYSFLFVLVLVVSVSLFAGSAVGGHENPDQNVNYSITHNVSSNETTVQVAFTVTDSEKYDIWNGQWSVPKDAEIISASSAHSDSVEVTRNGTTVRLREEDGGSRNYETFYLTYETSSQFTVREYGGIRQFDGSLGAYRNHSSSVTVEFVGADVANTVRYSNHSVVSENSTVRLDGTGPIGFVTNVKVGESRVETDDFVVYGGKLTTSLLNNSYALSTSGTGIIPQYKQVPVLVIEENEYDVQFGNGSAGRYHRGVVYISENEVEEKGAALVLLTHEYTHAVTARVQGGSSTPRWFTEGASQYTEAMAREQVGKRQVRIDDQQFTDYESSNESWIVTSWDSRVNKSNIHFAYTYSELLFKSVEKDESGTIRTLYSNMVTGDTSVSSETTPRVLFGDTWNGTACGASMDCADNTLEFVPNSSPPESYMLAVDGVRTNQSVDTEQADSTESNTTENETDSKIETETETNTTTETNEEETTTQTDETTTDNQNNTATQTETETETEPDTTEEPESSGGVWAMIESIIKDVQELIESLFGYSSYSYHLNY